VPDASEYIYVTYTNASGTETVLSSSQYSITINSVATGQIWASGFTLTYPTSGAPIANGTSLTVQRILPLQQLTSLENQGNFYPQAVEAGLDVLEMQIQQVSARTGSYRGVWATNVIYNFGDIVQDGINGAYTNNIYVCAIANTSGTWATDLAAGDWSLALNVQTLSATAGYLPLSGGTISGNLAVTGTTTTAAINASGTITGNVIGNITGNVIGNTSGSTVAASTSIKLNGSPVFDKIIVQKFTSSGTYTPTTGMVYAVIEFLGAGGGGGGTAGGTSSTSGSGGGGGGSYGKKVVTANQIGSSASVTIGAGGSAASGNNNGSTGGTTSVVLTGTGGLTLSATGGTGGYGSTNASGGTILSQGGSGGSTVTNSDYSVSGGNGSAGIATGASFAIPGAGGGSALAPYNPNTQAGGENYGGSAGTLGQGGSGNVSNNSSFAGATGGNGIVIVTEYVSA
jgi:hypothetical protein